MQIKLFSFPPFNEWLNQDKDWIGKVGDYYCRVCIFSWEEKSACYIVAISTSSNPSNIYSKCQFRETRRIDYTDTELLQLWYNQTTQKANEEFSKHIFNTYLNFKIKEIVDIKK